MPLKDFINEPHPTREIFKKYGIKNAVVGNYIDRNPFYVSGLLTGNVKCSAQLDRRLWQFARLVEKELGDNKGNAK